jgi:hypothetical protein
VTTPLVLKPRLSWFGAWRFPLPETVDWTTPCSAPTKRLVAPVEEDAAPTDVYAATMAATDSAPRR